MSPAHQSPLLGELVCSNSLRSDDPIAPAGLLKQELRRAGSMVIACADQHRVPAGQALAVERFGFARAITQRLALHPRIRIERRRIEELPEHPVIVATGPLTEGALGEVIRARARRRPDVLLRRDRADRRGRFDRLGLRVPRVALGPRRRRADPHAEAGSRGGRRHRRRRLRQLPAEQGRVRGVRRRGQRGPQGAAARLRGAALLRELHADRGDGGARRRRRCGSGRCARSACAIRAPGIGRGRSSSCARRTATRPRTTSSGSRPGSRIPSSSGSSR